MRVVSIAVLCLVVMTAHSAFAATVPQVISAMGREMDRQVVERLQQGDSPAQGVSLVVLTPVDNNNLEVSNPLARQVQEELARWFVQAGYPVQEVRKGADLLFEPSTGEMLLTRRSTLLESDKVGSAALVTGTYTVTPKHVRFNMRMVLTSSREVIAMSTMTVDVNGEVSTLLQTPGEGGGRGGSGGMPIYPTVVTLLP